MNEKLQVEVNFQKAPRIWAKALHDGQKAGLGAALLHWHTKYLPFHFESFSTAKYGYRKRTSEYEEKKIKKVGHNKPLVWSGETRKTMLGQMPRPIVTLKEARLVFSKLGKYMYVILPTHPMKNLEATTVTQGEGDALSNTIMDAMDKHFTGANESETVS